MNCLIKNTLQYTISIVFIVSGVLKAINPYSFSETIKGFSVLLGQPILHDYSMYIAVIICSLELLTGLLLYVMYKKVITILCFGILAFFTYITYLNYTDLYGQIESCGCFGEIVHLSPIETFYKNIILLVMSGVLVWQQRYDTHIHNKDNKKGFMEYISNRYLWASVIVSLVIPVYSCISMNIMNRTLFAVCYVLLCIIGLIICWRVWRNENLCKLKEV